MRQRLGARDVHARERSQAMRQITAKASQDSAEGGSETGAGAGAGGDGLTAGS